MPSFPLTACHGIRTEIIWSIRRDKNIKFMIEAINIIFSPNISLDIPSCPCIQI